MTDEQLRDEVLTIFLAGYETVANALTWTWYLLAQNPEAEARLHAEIDAVLGATPCPRLRTCLGFAIRRWCLLNPCACTRRRGPWAGSTADVELGPYRFPAGTYFFSANTSFSAARNIFPTLCASIPNAFSPRTKSQAPALCLFPFGAGSRQCIGEAFAWMEGVLMVATIRREWRLQFVPGQTVDVQPKITLRPKYPMMFVPELR